MDKVDATVQNLPHICHRFVHFRCRLICIPAHNCSARSVFMFSIKPTQSLCSRASFEARWRNHRTKCHSFLNSVSGCLNWLASCQLWTEVWIWFSAWLLLLRHFFVCPLSRYEAELGGRGGTERRHGQDRLGSPFGGLHFKLEKEKSTILHKYPCSPDLASSFEEKSLN